MYKIRFLFLALFSYIFLSGFLFEERGATPSPHVEIKTNTHTSVVDEELLDEFPRLKIKAFEPTSTKKEETKQPIEKKTSPLPKPKKQHTIKVLKKQERTKPSRIKIQQTQTKQVTTRQPSKEKILPRRRKSGHANKLIFSKETSLKDIPLPLPSLSSLKLKSLIKSLPSIPASKIPILRSFLPEGSKTSHRRIRNGKLHIIQDNAPLSSNSNDKSANLDMGNIRIGKSKDYTTLIFDSYKWAGYDMESKIAANESGNYEFNYEPKNHRIVALIKGYTAFSALLGDQSELFKESDVIKNIYIDRYVGKDSIQFIIQLKKKVKITVLDVKNPARIIVTLYPQ